MNLKKSLALISALLCGIIGVCQQVYVIPKQTFQPYKILGSSKSAYGYKEGTPEYNLKMAIDSFEISRQVTFKQYKLYLESVKRDSSYNFYISQLPDSNITSKENYANYISNKKYNDFPVAGISWEAAMNYCKWRTLQENKNGDLKFIYRLPKLSEWLAAYDFLETGNNKNDFSKDFSDWTMNTYFEGIFGFKTDSAFVFDLFLDLPQANDPPRDKRKMIAGNSYLFQSEVLRNRFSIYTFNGYRQIAFRLVKEQIENGGHSTSLYKNILASWGIK